MFKKKDRSKNNIILFNYMRLCKQMILPHELVDLIGNRKINRFRNEMEMSCLK